MVGAKKIRIAAFHGEHADTAGVVIQRPGVEPAHSRVGEVFLKFGPSFLALAVNDLVMLADVDNFLGKGRPLEDFVEWSDVWRVGIDLSEAGDGAEFEAAALLQSNGGTLVRDHRLRGVDDGLEHALQIQGGSDFVADSVERFQDFDFALGHEQAGVMKGGGSCVIETGKSKKIVVVEGSAIQLVDSLDDADEEFAVHDGDSNQGVNKFVAGLFVALNEPWVRSIVDADTFTV